MRLKRPRGFVKMRVYVPRDTYDTLVKYSNHMQDAELRSSRKPEHIRLNKALDKTSDRAKASISAASLIRTCLDMQGENFDFMPILEMLDAR